VNVCSPVELNTHVGFPDIGSIGHPPSAAADGPTDTIETMPASSNTSQNRHECATRVIRQPSIIASLNDAASPNTIRRNEHRQRGPSTQTNFGYPRRRCQRARTAKDTRELRDDRICRDAKDADLRAFLMGRPGLEPGSDGI
jgi:hypothetical protein